MSPVTLQGLVPANDLQACVVQHTAGHMRILASLFDKMTPFDSFLKKAVAFAAWVLRAFVWRALSAFFSSRPILARVSRRITFARRGPGKSSASC